MSRNTHDLELDHHGAFVAADFAVQADDPTAPASGVSVFYAKDDGFYAQDSEGTIVGPIGAGGGGGIQDFLTGNDSTFGLSTGAWVNSGGTMTWDGTSSYRFSNSAGSMKFITTAQNQYVEVAVSGTFRAGQEYQALLLIEQDNEAATGTSWDVRLGLIGTDSNSMAGSGTPNLFTDWYNPMFVRWVPTADRTGVKLRFTRIGTETGTITWHIGWARVASVEANGRGLAMVLEPSLTAGAGPTIVAPHGLELKVGDGLAPHLRFDRQSFELRSGRNDGYAYVSGTHELAFVGAEHVAEDKPQKGVNVEVGTDYIGFFIGQKNANTVQFYADWDDYNFEFEDGAANGWKFVSVDGATAWPAKGMLPQYTAAPSGAAPVEGQSYYNTTSHKPFTWSGSTWVELGGGTASLAVDDLTDVVAGSPSDNDVLTWDSGTSKWVNQASVSGVSVLDDLTDVTAPTPSDNDVLTWDSTSSKWINQALPPGGSNAVDDLTDVVAPSPSDNDVLTWDSGTSKWVNQALPAEASHAVDDLSDVVAPTPSDNDVLTWDSTTSKWINQALPAEASHVLDDLTDVNAPTPSDNDVLTWDSTTSKWIPQVAPGASGGDSTGQFIVNFDGGGSVLTANSWTDIVAPYSGTITGWTLLADQSGSAVVDIWKDTYANYPPTDADSKTASAPPTLTSAIKAASTSLTGWTTSVTAGDILRFNLDSASTVTRLLLVVDYTRS